MPTGMPRKLSSGEMERLLKSNGYLWDNFYNGFRRIRNIENHETTQEYLAKPPNVISFEELEDSGCFALDATVQQRDAAETWLRERLKLAKHSN